MSRIGKMPVQVPSNVTVQIDNNLIKVKGPLGELSQEYSGAIKFSEKDGFIIVERDSEDKETRAKHGLYRTLLNNMVIGVTKGYEESLVINGVGFKIAKQGNKLVLNVGFSHQVEVFETDSVKLEAVSEREIKVKGINKVEVGQMAANIKAIRKPDPYHAYGIRYKDEVIERKEGKTAGK